MAPYSSSKFRAPPGRPRKTPKAPLKGSGQETTEGPPLKKRRYIPGGAGGGGRYVEIDVVEEKPKVKPTPIKRTPSSSRSRPTREPEPETKTEPAPAPTPQPQPQLQLVHLPPPPPPPVPATPPSARLRRDKSQTGGRFTSSTAAALALQQGDGYKPREERGWEEFHPDLDIDAKVAVFTSEEVDRPAPSTSLAEILALNGIDINGDKDPLAELIRAHTSGASPTPIKRKPGRPPRRPEAILNSLGITPQPKVIPPPGPNPRERLTLPKPSFRLRDPFIFYDHPGVGQQNYVDRTMASVGYQESDLFIRHERQMIRMTEGAQEDDLDIINPPTTDGEVNAAVGRVEYDMDEQDEKWLEDYNMKRKEDQLELIKPAVFEITMTKIEKEWHTLEKRIPKPNPKPPQTQRPRSSSAAAVNGEPGPGEEQDSKCAVCDDGDCENSNAIVFCDGCDLAVHQECYGVPFIPEGQWLCRKCQLIGRGSVNCIFCPNTEGAFKQTTSSKWSHLLCAIWIPEVSIGNPSLMEPVTDVEKVPRSRWKLQCYICRQKMGASIQCSNKNCFVAFHVTCARRAQLYLKMKTGHGTPAVMDSHLLKAFCDKHVPPDWRREHGTDVATADAIEYYRNTMEGRRWGDSQATALSLEPSHPLGCDHADEDGPWMTHTPRITLTVGGNKRKRTGPPRTIWKLPSGAPVIPQVVLNSVVASLQRFGVRQRKQYAEDACKYWTLKREARRGAALLKRLQLSLETFSSMEMTRRDYVAMGVQGGKRLQRRIEFGERLSYDLDRLRMLCDEVKKREKEKLKDAETLKSVVDVVYFPIFPLLWPIFEKAQMLDGKNVFAQGLSSIRAKLEQRYYPSVNTFSTDLARIFTSEIGVQQAEDTAELQMQISGRAPELSLEQREKRKLAKRILKSIQPALEDAVMKESELNRRPFEKELKELDLMFENSMLSRRGSVEEDSTEPAGDEGLSRPEDKSEAPKEAPNGLDNTVAGGGEVAKLESQGGSPLTELPEKTEDTPMPDADSSQPPEPSTEPSTEPPAQDAIVSEPTAPEIVVEPENQKDDVEATAAAEPPTETQPTSEAETNEEEVNSLQLSAKLTELQKEPLTPPPSFQGDQQLPFSQGGIQWYMQPFDPVGTTIHEERWMGRDVMRGMSEELSELDEEELKDLDDELDGVAPNQTPSTDDGPTEQAVKVHRTRRRWRGFK